MATIVLTDAMVLVDGATAPPTVDISTYVKTVTINYSSEALDVTAMGADTKIRKGGLFDWSIDLDLYQDFVDDGLDEDFWTAISTGAAVNIEIRPDHENRSAANAAYTCKGMIESWGPVAGTVGEMDMVRCRFVPTKKVAGATHADCALALQRKTA